MTGLVDETVIQAGGSGEGVNRLCCAEQKNSKVAVGYARDSCRLGDLGLAVHRVVCKVVWKEQGRRTRKRIGGSW